MKKLTILLCAIMCTMACVADDYIIEKEQQTLTTGADILDLPEHGSMYFGIVRENTDQNGDAVYDDNWLYFTQFEGQDSYDQDPGTPRPYAGPIVTSAGSGYLNNEPVVYMECHDQTANDLWWNGRHPAQQAFADSRTTYDDSPTTIPMDHVGGSNDIDLTTASTGIDPEQLLVQTNVALNSASAACAAARNARYLVDDIDADGDYPGFEPLGTGFDLFSGNVISDFGAYVPPEPEGWGTDFDKIDPSVTFEASTDFSTTVSLDTSASWDSTWPYILYVLDFVSMIDYGEGVRPTIAFTCFTHVNPLDTTVSVAIDSSLFDEAGFPQSGIVRASLRTQVVWNVDEGRFDAVGAVSSLASYTVTQ